MKLLELAEYFRSALASERELLAGYRRLKGYQQSGGKFQALQRRGLTQNYLSTLKLDLLEKARQLELAKPVLQSKQQTFHRIRREVEALEAAHNQVDKEAQHARHRAAQRELDELALRHSSRQPGRQRSFVLL